MDSFATFLNGNEIAYLISWLITTFLTIFVQWNFFKKCGEKSWKSLIPFYNDWTLVKISGCHWWYFLLMIINYVGMLYLDINEINGILLLAVDLVSIFSLYVILCINYNISKKFKQGIGFAIGLCFVPLVFYSILTFSDKYKFKKSIKLNSWGIYDFETKKNMLKENKKFCKNCGYELSSNFCPKCGKSKKGE